MKKIYKFKTVCLVTSISLALCASAKTDNQNFDRGGPGPFLLATGTASFAVNSYESASHMSSDLNVSDGVTGDNLFETGWFFRLDSDTQEFPLGVPSDVTVPIPNTALLQWDDVADRDLISAELIIELEQPAAGEATLRQTMIVANISDGPVTLNLFAYQDFDLGGSFSGNNASAVTPPDIDHITLDGVGTDVIDWRAGTPDAIQIGDWPAIRDLLIDTAITDFDNSGLPSTNIDFTGGYQWTVVIPRFGQLTVQTSSSFNSTAPVPMDAELFDDVIWRDGFDNPGPPPVR